MKEFLITLGHGLLGALGGCLIAASVLGFIYLCITFFWIGFVFLSGITAMVVYIIGDLTKEMVN